MAPARRQPAVILPVVLILIALLSLTMAGFVFFVRAEAEGITAYTDGQQARLAAESGLEEIIALLKKLSKERNVTVISATHDFKMLNVSDQVVWIRDGRIDKIEDREELSISVGTIGTKQ